MTVYAIKNKETGKTRMVEAQNNAQARKHVADDLFEITVPTQKEVFHLASKGVELENYDGDTKTDGTVNDQLSNAA